MSTLSDLGKKNPYLIYLHSRGLCICLILLGLVLFVLTLGLFGGALTVFTGFFITLFQTHNPAYIIADGLILCVVAAGIACLAGVLSGVFMVAKIFISVVWGVGDDALAEHKGLKPPQTDPPVHGPADSYYS